jgi:hypothetical protein
MENSKSTVNFFKQPWVIAVAVAALTLIIIYVYVKSQNADFLAGFADVIVPEEECTTCTTATLPISSLSTLSAGSTSVKRALLIGCNYNYAGSACVTYDCILRGCIQDVRNISSTLLTRFGYPSTNIEVLVDDGSTVFPSKAIIIARLTNLVQSMSPGDVSFVWFSGHGAQVYNPSSEGNYDECWCPPDTIAGGNYLTDDELSLIIRQAPADSRLFIGSDSCHSGTVFDLQFIAQEADAQGANRGKMMSRIRGRVPLDEKIFEAKPKGNLEIPRFLDNYVLSRGVGQDLIVISDSKYEETRAHIVALSGSQDYDTSADAFEGGQFQGAMSWSFLRCLDPTITLSDLLKNMRTMLKTSGYSQIPQITMGRLLNPNVVTLGSILM